MFGHILWQMFNWPAGNVLGNLIASLIWALATAILLRIHHNQMKNHINTTLQEHHDKVIAHIDNKIDTLTVEVKVDQGASDQTGREAQVIVMQEK